MNDFDVLVVGAGLYGCVFARMCKDAGLSVIIVDERKEIGGNCYDYKDKETGITVQKYGAHIFRTSDEKVWSFLNRFTTFKPFTHVVKAIYKNKLYSLPFNMYTFNEIYGVETPEQAKKIIDEKTNKYKNIEPKNLEEQALKLAGEDIYNILIKGYSEKQWGRPCTELPADTMRRIKFRYEFNNDYFSETHQGIPSQGYTQMLKNMTKDIPYISNYKYTYGSNVFSDKVVYSGRIDKLFDFMFGELEYRTLNFKTETYNFPYYQQHSVINYTDTKPLYTRTIEHKHFLSELSDKTIVTFEYPEKFTKNSIPFYPVNDEKNNALYRKYKEHADTLFDISFGGALGRYQYNDMNETVKNAMRDAEIFIKERKFR